MRKFLQKGKRAVVSALALSMLLQYVPAAGITAYAGASDPPYQTELESNVPLMDGRPNESYINSHYYSPSRHGSIIGVSAIPDKAASYGNGTTTAYKFGLINAGSSGTNLVYKYDFNGIVQGISAEPAREEDEAYVISYGGIGGRPRGEMSVTYPASTSAGFDVGISFGPSVTGARDLGSVTTARREAPALVSAGKFYPEKDGEFRNGEVMKVYNNGGTTDMKLEVRLSVKPSFDGKYILTEYTVYNANTNPDDANAGIVDPARRSSAGGDGGRTVWFSSGSDIQIAGHDGAPIWNTVKTSTTRPFGTDGGAKPEGIHAISYGGNTYHLAAFDMFTYHPQLNLGVTRRDAADTSTITNWVGHYTEYPANLSTQQANVSFMTGGTSNALDSGLAFSFKFDLLPGETKTGTMAWSMRGPTYYVDPANGSDATGDGFVSKPFKTIQRAANAIAARSPQKAYIFVMNDDTLSAPVILPAGKDITIQTTDYTWPTGVQVPVAYDITTDANNIRNNSVTVKRAPGYQGHLFVVKDAGGAGLETTLSLNDIVIDGNGADPSFAGAAPILGSLVWAREGKVNIQSGAILKNNHIKPIPAREAFEDTDGNGMWNAGESFTDANGDGVWNRGGEPFTDTDGNGMWNAPEPFLDLNFNGSYDADAGEPFTDANANGVWDEGEAFMDTNSNETYDDAVNALWGSAIDVGDNAKLSLNYGEITGNTAYQGGAVRFAGSGDLTAEGGVKVSGNTNSAGKPANVVLVDDRKIGVTGSLLGYARMGISVQKPFSTLTTETLVAEKKTSGTDLPYNLGHFPADKAPAQWTELRTDEKVVLKANAYQYNVSYVREDNGATISASVGASRIAGVPIRIVPADLSASGYVYDSFEFSPAPPVTDPNYGLNVSAATGAITGPMPGSDINIIYKYARNKGIAKFDTNGGLPAAIAPIEMNVGVPPAVPMPTVTRNGYLPLGWFEFTDANGNGRWDQGIPEPFTDTDSDGVWSPGEPFVDINSDGVWSASVDEVIASAASTTLGDPLDGNKVKRGTKFYHMKWTPDPTGRAFEVRYKNNNANIPLTFGSNSTAASNTQPITASAIAVPGYVRLTQNVAPSSAGSFNPSSNYDFSGTMGVESVLVNYVYRVDTTQRFTFRVEHWTQTGLASGLSAPDLGVVNRSLFAETPIAAQPINRLGFDPQMPTFLAGDTGAAPVMTVLDLQTAAGLATGFAADKSFTGYMPNQNVTIRYVYSSTADYFVIKKHEDRDNANALVGALDPIPLNLNDTLNIVYNPIYGYLLSSAVVAPAADPGAGENYQVNSSHVLTGNMPGKNLTLTYGLNRDPAYWKTIRYAVVTDTNHNQGSVGGVTSATFLRDDGSSAATGHAHTFGDIKAAGNVATPTPSPVPYYMFDAWYKDPAGTVPVLDTDTFGGDVTLYARFVEDPRYWIDIQLDAAAHGQLAAWGSTTTPAGAPLSLHTYYDNTWAQITPPAVIPEVHYLHSGWTVGGVPVNGSTPLVGGATYLAQFGKDPAVWGTNVGHFTAAGRVAEDGDGLIEVRGAVPGNVYVVTDTDGNVVAVRTAPSPADGLTFDDLFPGTTYHVREAAPGTNVRVGENVNGRTDLSTPQEVIIPALGFNYSVGYDPVNEDRVQIVVNPADPDSDYAIIDENGNVVAYPDAAGGWKTPTGTNPPIVIFDNLDPNGTYKVVARKKGDSSKSPQDKLREASTVVANPGDLLDAPKFIVETKNGIVESVGSTTVGASRYENALSGERVRISADAVDGNGKNFKYWRVMNGHNSQITGNITSRVFEFNMDPTNIVLKAVYERMTTSPLNAEVEEEVRGGSQGEFALNPDDIGNLEAQLTTDQDRILMGVNGADVTYRIVFDKRATDAADKALVEPLSVSGTNHGDAFHSAWTLHVSADRYVDGRKVARATDSNATTRAVVQLNAQDIDMLDYELFDVTGGSAVPVAVADDIEQTAGLFEFTANINHKYVLVYSKAFKLTFLDNNQSLDSERLNEPVNFRKKFKVRRGENPADSYYASDYAAVEAYVARMGLPELRTPFDRIDGSTYVYEGWSLKDMPANRQAFDPASARIRKHTVVYAYYSHNLPVVLELRGELSDLILQGEELGRSPFIRASSLADLMAALAEARAVLAKERTLDLSVLRKANEPELRAAIQALLAVLNRIRAEIDRTSADYLRRSGGSSGGGSGSAGRGAGGGGRPFEAVPEKFFTLGVNGNWERDAETGKYRFILNGGLPLNSTWGKIQYTDENGRLITSWYYFDGSSDMVTGWYHDAKADKWYHLSTEAGVKNGRMLTGWFRDADSSWYYLDPVTGEMYKGWHMIGEHWYYFSPNRTADGKPQGSLYVNRTTPDGYTVNHNGEWVR